MAYLHNEETFLEYYRLEHNPFLARTPGFKFYPAQRKTVLGQLLHLARHRRILLVVQGVKGSGKTLLQQALAASLDKQLISSILLSGKEIFDLAGVLHAIATRIDAPIYSLADLVSYTEQLVATGKMLYVMIDDADRLEDEAIQALMSLATRSVESGMRCFLFATTNLVENCQRVSTQEHAFYNIRLQPYTLEETSEYLSLRLEGAGQSLEIFTQEQVAHIHAAAAGWPGLINQIAYEELIEQMLFEQQEEPLQTRKSVSLYTLIVLMGCIFLGLTWGFYAQQTKIQSSPSMHASPTAIENTKNPASIIEFTDTTAQVQVQVQDATPIMREPLAQASSVLHESLPHVSPVNAENLSEESTLVSEEAVAAPVIAQTNPELSQESLQKTASSMGNQLMSVPSKPVELEVKSSGALKSQEETEQSKSAVIGSTSTKDFVESKPASQPLPTNTEKTAKDLAPQNPQTAILGNLEWYRAQNPTRVTIQLFATSSATKAKDFVAQNGSEYHFYAKMHQGKPLYVVTYGVFSGAVAANAAITELSKHATLAKPWPRKFADIQREMLQKL